MEQDNWPFNQQMNHGNDCVVLSQRLSLLDELLYGGKHSKLIISPETEPPGEADCLCD